MKRRDRDIEGVIDGTKSVVPLAARFDFDYARQEVSEGDIERVRAGMELLTWTYDDAEWQRHARASASRLEAAGAAEDGNLLRSVLFGKSRADWVMETLGGMPLPTVSITSTGILFGELARPWRGKRRLASACVEHLSPDYLVLAFERRWGILHWARRELWVPIPEPLEQDVRELAGTLNGWLKRGGKAPLAPRP